MMKIPMKNLKINNTNYVLLLTDNLINYIYNNLNQDLMNWYKETYFNNSDKQNVMFTYFYENYFLDILLDKNDYLDTKIYLFPNEDIEEDIFYFLSEKKKNVNINDIFMFCEKIENIVLSSNENKEFDKDCKIIFFKIHNNQDIIYFQKNIDNLIEVLEDEIKLKHSVYLDNI